MPWFSTGKSPRDWCAMKYAAAISPEAIKAAGRVKRPMAMSSPQSTSISAAMPTLMLFVGTDDGTPGAPGLHHPLYVPSDDVIAEVASAYLAGFRAAVDLSGEPQNQAARVKVTCVTPLDEDVASNR